MMNWLNDNSQALNTLLNAGMLLIWLLYFQLLYLSFRAQKRPNLLINRSAGNDARSHCLISNMSASAVYVQAILLDMSSGGRHWTATISDMQTLGSDETASQAMERTKQGPLKEGDFMDIGSFEDLVDTAIGVRSSSTEGPNDISDVDTLTVTVAAVYTSKNTLIGAHRSFRVSEENGRIFLRPETTLANQIASLRQRRKLARLVTAAG
ncbi:hypothetical protein [Pararhizobium haloflavum]|uniref:hypothetical protein n=1 Tax=Pararhizobium haloflavum TaxID=2037914 RepID=UPI000C19C3B3|nr:hypothetical protein [Pararhizobium haloflavum]